MPIIIVCEIRPPSKPPAAASNLNAPEKNLTEHVRNHRNIGQNDEKRDKEVQNRHQGHDDFRRFGYAPDAAEDNRRG